MFFNLWKFLSQLLIHADLYKPFVLEMNTFDFVIAIMFSQLGKTIFFIFLVFILVSFFLQRLIMRFMIKNF